MSIQANQIFIIIVLACFVSNNFKWNHIL